MACKYIEEYNCPPPVLFDNLLKLPLSPEFRKGIDELLEIKKVTDEKTLNPQIPVIYDFIASELAVQKKWADEIADDHKKDWETLNYLFQLHINI